MIRISGGLWLVQRDQERSGDWSLDINGATVSGGILSCSGANTSGSPLELATGSGGPAALSAMVAAGDVVRLMFTRAPGHAFATFIGVKLRIELSSTSAHAVAKKNAAMDADLSSFTVQAFRSLDPSRDDRLMKAAEALDKASERLDKEFGGSEAIALHAATLELREARLGPDHDDTLQSRNESRCRLQGCRSVL